MALLCVVFKIAAIAALHIINWSVFITEMERVYCELNF